MSHRHFWINSSMFHQNPQNDEIIKEFITLPTTWLPWFLITLGARSDLVKRESFSKMIFQIIEFSSWFWWHLNGTYQFSVSILIFHKNLSSSYFWHSKNNITCEAKTQRKALFTSGLVSRLRILIQHNLSSKLNIPIMMFFPKMYLRIQIYAAIFGYLTVSGC